MIPIEKNIIVTDSKGNKYENTYPKRAKGLVKNGRARFINKNTICLTLPPENKTEGRNMSENINANEQKYSIPYVLEQIEKLHTEMQNLERIYLTIHGVGDSNSIIKDEDGNTEQNTLQGEVAVAKLKTISEIFHHREESLQKLLAFYEKIYDDLKPVPEHDSERVTLLKTVIENLGEGMTPVESKEALQNILETSLQDLTKNI